MNIREAFKQLRDAIEWLFDELNINEREDRPTIDELREQHHNLIPERSNKEFMQFAVVKMVSRMFGGAIFTEHQFFGIESALRILYAVFGADGPDAGMNLLTDAEYSDKSDITLCMHLEALNLVAQHFELIERGTEFSEFDLWGGVAAIAKLEKPDMFVWIMGLNRMTESLREGWYFEDSKSDRSMEINNELQDIFSVYRPLRPFEGVK